MAKDKKIGGISFTEEGYEKFVTLTKKEQVEKVYNSLNPKDYDVAEKALKNVPNGGNISKGSINPIAGDNASADTGASKASGNARSKSDTGKSK